MPRKVLVAVGLLAIAGTIFFVSRTPRATADVAPSRPMIKNIVWQNARCGSTSKYRVIVHLQHVNVLSGNVVVKAWKGAGTSGTMLAAVGSPVIHDSDHKHVTAIFEAPLSLFAKDAQKREGSKIVTTGSFTFTVDGSGTVTSGDVDPVDISPCP